jgi:hypothetical protein
MGKSKGTGTIDTTRSHSGGSSFHAQVFFDNPESCEAVVRRLVKVPAPDVFVRMFVYMPPTSVASGIMSFSMATMSKTMGGYAAVGAYMDAGKLGMTGWGDVTTPSMTETTAFPTNQWVCVEFQVHQQGAKSTFTVWRNDVQTIAPTPIKVVDTSEPLDGIDFGIYAYNNLGTVDAWYDDLAMSATRIGCEAP